MIALEVAVPAAVRNALTEIAAADVAGHDVMVVGHDAMLVAVDHDVMVADHAEASRAIGIIRDQEEIEMINSKLDKSRGEMVNISQNKMLLDRDLSTRI